MPGERSKKRVVDEAPAVTEEEEAFPRGGADSLLTPLQKRQLTAQANADAAAEQSGDGRKAKKARPSKTQVGKRDCCTAAAAALRPSRRRPHSSHRERPRRAHVQRD